MGDSHWQDAANVTSMIVDDLSAERNHGLRWQRHDEQLLITMIRDGVDMERICQRLGRTAPAVRERVSELKARGELK